jgi:hypothetical protein
MSSLCPTVHGPEENKVSAGGECEENRLFYFFQWPKECRWTLLADYRQKNVEAMGFNRKQYYM